MKSLKEQWKYFIESKQLAYTLMAVVFAVIFVYSGLTFVGYKISGTISVSWLIVGLLAVLCLIYLSYLMIKASKTAEKIHQKYLEETLDEKKR